MSELTLWGWDKKPRTMLRYIKAGDIFCFQYNEETYCFGRIISTLEVGHPAEVFDYISTTPIISEEIIENAGRMFHPVNMDVYSLFDRKQMGEWRIIGSYDNFEPVDVDDVFFAVGVPPCVKMDVYGNNTIITEAEAKTLPDDGFMTDFHIKELVKSKIGKEYIDSSQSNAEKRKASAFEEKIKPFGWVGDEDDKSASLLLDPGNYKDEIFLARADEGFEGGGYDWESLARVFLDEEMPELAATVHFDSEASMFCAYSESADALKEFALGFKSTCENDELIRDLFSRAELD